MDCIKDDEAEAGWVLAWAKENGTANESVKAAKLPVPEWESADAYAGGLGGDASRDKYLAAAGLVAKK